MAGFGIDEYEERVPCPFCESTDCACVAVVEKAGKTELATLYCGKTGKTPTHRQLLASARKHGLAPTKNEILGENEHETMLHQEVDRRQPERRDRRTPGGRVDKDRSDDRRGDQEGPGPLHPRTPEEEEMTRKGGRR